MRIYPRISRIIAKTRESEPRAVIAHSVQSGWYTLAIKEEEADAEILTTLGITIRVRL